MRVSLTVLALLALSGDAVAAPGAEPFDDARALAYSQAALGREVGDHRFVDRNGQPLGLQQLRGRPLVVSLIYTSCYHTCPSLSLHLARVLEVAREALGEDSFAVATIGFDAASDTPERMRSYASTRGLNDPQWRFLSSDAATINALSQDLGFLFFPSPKGFDHLAQTTVLDAEGRIYRQVYGENFSTPALVEPLKQLVFGRPTEGGVLTEWVSRVRLFCTIYDPSSGRYRFDNSLFIAIGVGLLCLGAVAVFLVRAWGQSRPGKPAA